MSQLESLTSVSPREPVFYKTMSRVSMCIIVNEYSYCLKLFMNSFQIPLLKLPLYDITMVTSIPIAILFTDFELNVSYPF